MIILADLCMQYTALVDSHIPKLAACIRDSNEFVRRQGLALLANLLSKVLSLPLFPDSDPSISRLVTYCQRQSCACLAMQD